MQKYIYSMKSELSKYFTIAGILLIFCSAGCIKSSDLSFKNLQLTNWTPDWAFPLMKAKLTMLNLLKPNDVVNTDSTGLYVVHYSSKGFTFNASDIIKMPNQNFSVPFGLSNPITSLPAGTSISDSFISNFSYNDSSGASLAHINLKAGTLQVSFTNNYAQTLQVTMVFPFIKKLGIPLTISALMSYPISSNFQNIDLTDYVIDMTNGNTTRNYIGYKVYFTLTGSGQPIPNPSNIVAGIDLVAMQFSYLDGTLGNYNIPIPQDTVNVGLFNKTINADIYLKNPKFHLNFSNSLGLGITAYIDTFYGLTATGTNVNLVIPPLSINAAATVTQPTTTNYTIDSTNSTIQNLLNPAPNIIFFKGNLSINPGSSWNFLTDTSKITLATDVELPAYFKVVSFALQDTVKLLMPGDTDMLSYANFAFQITNAFPLYAAMQFYFADSNYVVLDSLVTPNANIIPMAPVNTTGTVNGTAVKTSGFGMDHNRYHQMASKVRYGLVRGNLYSSGPGAIQIHNTDSMAIRMAFKFGLNVTFVGF
jgi:hypothetical protein